MLKNSIVYAGEHTLKVNGDVCPCNTHTHTREEDLKRVSAVVVMKVLSFSPLIFPMQGRTGLISVRTMERLMMLIEKKEREKG